MLLKSPERGTVRIITETVPHAENSKEGGTLIEMFNAEVTDKIWNTENWLTKQQFRQKTT